jgi:hypothetical protein
MLYIGSNPEVLMARRAFLRQLVALPLVGMTSWGQQATHQSLNIMMKSAWGSDDPTKAAFPFFARTRSIRSWTLGPDLSTR